MTWPVFVSTGARDPLRIGAAVMTLSYWLRHMEADVTVIEWADCGMLRSCLAVVGLPLPRWVEIEEHGSQRERHVLAARMAAERGAEFHIVADDDVLPRPEFSIAVAVDLMRQRPECAMACAVLPNCPLAGHHDGQYGTGTGAISECGAAGGVRVCRTEFFRHFAFPPISGEYGPRSYDMDLADGIRHAGAFVGFFGDASPRTLRATHLAETPELSHVWTHDGRPASAFPI